MKKYLSFLLMSLPVLLFLLSSCDKDDDTPKTKTELLVQSPWKFKSASVGGNPYTSLQSCQTDDILSFNTSGAGVVDEGATKCNALDPQTRPFTWSFQNGETMILFSSPLFTNGSSTVSLVSLTETQLVMIITVTTIGPSFNVEVSFQH